MESANMSVMSFLMLLIRTDDIKVQMYVYTFKLNKTIKTFYYLSKTGYKLGVCHGIFLLYWLIQAVNHEKKARIKKN